MSDAIFPPADHETMRPEIGEDFVHHSTLPPFASDARVRDLEDKHAEVMATLGEIRNAIRTLSDRVGVFHEEIRRGAARAARLEARLAIIEGGKAGTDG